MSAKRKTAARFESEAALCAAFIAAIGPDWTAYAETEGWDILLVRKADGFQIGIEAKLSLNATVLLQALEDYTWEYSKFGPDCRAVLVPWSDVTGGLTEIAARLALTVIRASIDPYSTKATFDPRLPTERDRWSQRDWHELCPQARHPLPEYVPDVAAGTSAPIQLTAWKIAAMKLAILLETRGYLTRTDFKVLHVDPRRWMDNRWLVAGPQGLVAGDRFPQFKTEHPRVYGEIAADAAKWMKGHDAARLIA